ncbi:peptidoglycan-binding protein [Hominifimenecus sp. rT4P-3]|uniref:peptidoglycan-binding domain-containing protein n=1 Tax=Hominifimenecus sp. rT4P-3 TaxID=3242979 RepID=UPI003DA3BEFC
MTIQEKRSIYRAALLSREKKNQYSQSDSKRLLVESGWGDCSSTPYYWLKKLFGLRIGDYTGAQIKSPLGKQVPMEIRGGIPDETKMEIGDHLYFRGNDASRPQGVGHVEIYIGDGKCFGHGSGMGGTVKDMASYCAKRQSTPSRSATLKNKGLICVIRFLAEDSSEDDLSAEEEIRTLSPVQKFQCWLNDRLKIGLEVDGSCGPRTKKAAVMAMQEYLNETYHAGLAVDGSFGPASRKAYHTVCRGVQGTPAFLVQGLLYGHGLNPNGFDGHCGPGCETAIRQFQKRYSLTVDGRCGPATFSALVKNASKG